MKFQKTFTTSAPHTFLQKRMGFSGGGRFSGLTQKNFKKCLKLNWNFQRDEGCHKKSTLWELGMDIFWNYKI